MTIDTIAAADATGAWYDYASKCLEEITHNLLDDMFEGQGAETPMGVDEIVAQIIMNWLGDADTIDKRRALFAAEHMGPDWAQALYHTSVFITKVA